MKELKHEKGMISKWFGPRFCGTTPPASTAGFPVPKILTSVSMLHPAAFTAVLFSSQCLEMELIQCKIALLSHPLLFSFSFFILDQLLDLIHHMNPRAVESAQLRLACCRNEHQEEVGAGGGRARPEHDF